MTASAATRKRVAAFHDSDYARVVGAVALATGDRERAEDAVQDALVATLSGDTEPDNLSGWITVVAINYVKQAWRRANTQDRAYVRAVMFEDDAGSESERTVASIAIHGALEQLPERQRTIMVMHYLEELTVEQVSNILGVSEGTVKTQLFRGRSTLAAHLGTEVAS